jgi:hypothetical protein
MPCQFSPQGRRAELDILFTSGKGIAEHFKGHGGHLRLSRLVFAVCR